MGKIKIWSYIFFLKYWYGFGAISTAVIYGQAKHETGNFTSTIFKENKNLFGMREPSVRKTYATGTARNHATFKNLFDSVRDYFLRQKDFSIDSGTDTGFIDSTVSSNYAEDRQYKEKWLKIIDGVKKPFSNWLIVLLFFFVVLASFLLFKSEKSNKKLKMKFKK